MKFYSSLSNFVVHPILPANSKDRQRCPFSTMALSEQWSVQLYTQIHQWLTTKWNSEMIIIGHWTKLRILESIKKHSVHSVVSNTIHICIHKVITSQAPIPGGPAALAVRRVGALVETRRTYWNLLPDTDSCWTLDTTTGRGCGCEPCSVTGTGWYVIWHHSKHFYAK